MWMGQDWPRLDSCWLVPWMLGFYYIFFLFWCMFKILHNKMFLNFYLKALFS